MIAIQRTAKKPLRPRRLPPIDTRREKGFPERLRNRRWNRADRIYSRKKAGRRELLQRIEFRKRISAVSGAGTFTNIFVRSKKPQLARLDRTSQGAHPRVP